MEFGLLWYDGNPKRSLEDKIRPAAERYREKFGRLPNTCYVNPCAVTGRHEIGPEAACRLENPAATIRLVSAANILRHHYWLGVAKNAKRASRETARTGADGRHTAECEPVLAEN
jgi:hypothetical protein